MDAILNIRHLYSPRQPTVRNTSGEVVYQEYSAHLELRPYIYCYWELRTHTRLNSPFTYRVVTDGCVDIFFELNETETSFVMGFCKNYTEFPLNNSFRYFGIRFLPTMFTQIFNIDASLLSNAYHKLEGLENSTSEFISTHLSSGLSSEKIVNLIDAYLLDRVEKSDFDHDGRLYDAIDIILKNRGVVNFEESINTGISHRQLRRLFHYYIGATPKLFSKVVQFQNILRAKPSTQSLKQNKLFYDLGYYDQAHFIKDFKTFYGVTPSKAFGRE